VGTASRVPQLERLVPPLSTLRGYRGRDLRRDVGAGLAVWAAAVPSGLAYAGLAGLPPIVGLYASAVAGLAYGVAGSIRQAQVGPTSTSSILTAAAIAPMAQGDVAHATGLAAILAIEVAAFLLLAWALRLGSSPISCRGPCSSASPPRSRWSSSPRSFRTSLG
jgi:SulP family sulfate permease